MLSWFGCGWFLVCFLWCLIVVGVAVGLRFRWLCLGWCFCGLLVSDAVTAWIGLVASCLACWIDAAVLVLELRVGLFSSVVSG